jgi:hypothetical protein
VAAQFFAYLDRHPCIEVFVWFNENKKNEPDFRLEPDTVALNVFRQWLAGANSGTTAPTPTASGQ